MGYSKNAIIGFGWSASLRGFTRFAALIRIIILARFFLLPFAFGLFAIVTLVLGFLEILTETGINIFLIQEKDSIKKFVHAAWIVSIIRGILITVVILLVAKPIASFFHSPQVEPLLLITALVPFIKGFINPSSVIFQKNLTFDKEFFYRASLFTIETVTIIATAYITKNAISFIYGFIASAITEVLFSFIFIQPRPAITLEKEKILHIIHRGKWVTLYGIFQYIAENADNMIVGKMLGTTPLAFYQNGYKLSTLPVSEVSDVISKVIFPIYTKIIDDKKRLWWAYVRSSVAITVLSTIVAVVIFTFPKEIIQFTLGPHWYSIVPFLKILAVYGFLRALSGPASAIFLAIKKQEYVAGMLFARMIGLLIVVIPLTQRWGLVGTSLAAVISVIIEIPVIIFFLGKVFL